MTFLLRIQHLVHVRLIDLSDIGRGVFGFDDSEPVRQFATVVAFAVRLAWFILHQICLGCLHALLLSTAVTGTDLRLLQLCCEFGLGHAATRDTLLQEG